MTNRQGFMDFFSLNQYIQNNMTSKISSRLKAVDQARQKVEDLTREGIVAFSLIMTDEGPELLGEEELTTQLFDIFEEKGIFEAAKRIKMRGNVLSHRSTRSLKISEMQEVFGTMLPPTLLPLEELLDYDLIRFAFNKMMKTEGLKSLWKTGQDPPPSVQEWWGNEDWEVFRLYENQNISKDVMELIRARHQRYKKNAIHFFKDKLRACYRHRLGEEDVDNFHMRLSNRELEVIKQRKIQIRAEAQNELDAEQERKIAAAVEERIQREVNERVEKQLKEQREKEKGRQASAAHSPTRRKNVRKTMIFDEDEEDAVENSDNQPSRSFPPMPAIADRIDHNSSILQDPCAIAVVRAPEIPSLPGPSSFRPARQMVKCPFEGCSVSRRTEEALRQHIENSHD